MRNFLHRKQRRKSVEVSKSTRARAGRMKVCRNLQQPRSAEINCAAMTWSERSELRVSAGAYTSVYVSRRYTEIALSDTRHTSFYSACLGCHGFIMNFHSASLSCHSSVNLFPLQFFEKLRNGFIEHRMAIVRRQLGQWNQYKIPVFHIDMRNMKIWCINDHLVV